MEYKYDKKLILDYVSGNDIEGYDIDELENDYKFMIEVIAYTKDKNMYALCSDEVKNNYMFIRSMVEIFYNDFDFIVELANKYLEKADQDDITYKELVVLISQLSNDIENENLYKFKVKAEVVFRCEMVEIECWQKYETDENLKRRIGLGFLFFMDKYGTSKILMDFFAKKLIDNIFYSDEKYKLENLIHANTKNKEYLNEENINNYIYSFVELKDEALAHHIVANNLHLIEHVKKDLEKIYNKWDNYMKRLNVRRNIILDDEVRDFIEKNKIDINFDIYELINYILVHLGYNPIEDEVTVYNPDSQIDIIKRLKNGEELAFIEQKLVNYLTDLINNLYYIDVIGYNSDDYNINDGEVINANFGAKK